MLPHLQRKQIFRHQGSSPALNRIRNAEGRGHVAVSGPTLFEVDDTPSTLSDTAGQLCRPPGLSYCLSHSCDTETSPRQQLRCARTGSAAHWRSFPVSCQGLGSSAIFVHNKSPRCCIAVPLPDCAAGIHGRIRAVPTCLLMPIPTYRRICRSESPSYIACSLY